jgi:hypothetical protein
MKHLKRINESFLDRSELREFCEMYLSYLLDTESFNIEVLPSDEGMATIILRNNPDGNTFSGDRVFNWSDIRDQYLPFLTMLDKSYSINSISTFQYGGSRKDTGVFKHTLRSIEKLSGDTKMKGIDISVSNKMSFIQRVKNFFN